MATKSNSGRHTFFMCVLFLMAAAAITMSAIALHRMLNDDDDAPSVVTPASDAEKGSAPPTTPGSTPLPDSRRGAVVDCYPKNLKEKDKIVTKEACEQRQCVWREASNSKAPKCIFPDTIGYEFHSISENGNTKHVKINRSGPGTVYGMPVNNVIDVTVDEYGDNALRIYFRPTNSQPFEIPDEALKINRPSPPTDKRYTVEIVKKPTFGVKVIRKSTKSVVFDSSLPGLTFSDQFLQISTRLPTDNLYGFGEHNHRRYRHDMNWRTWTIFTRDMAPVDDWNLYGAHPVYMNLEDKGKANMVFLKNSNAMEVTLQPSPYPAVTYRTIGGVLDFYVFLGENPNHALQQYLHAIGRPALPPYWTLGFHILRWGYENLTRMKFIHQRNVDADIPFDAQWGDIDYMYKKFDFTYDKKTFKGLPEFVDKVHGEGKKFVVIVDSGIGSDPQLYAEAKNNSAGYRMYEDGIEKDIFVKNASGQVLVGQVWPGDSVFPDFTNVKNTTMFWEKWIRYFFYNESIKADGLWIDMDEPANFVQGSKSGCPVNKWNHPPFVPQIFEGDRDNGSLYYKTLCMDGQQSWGKHYDVHSLYGHSKSIVTYKALLNISPNKRPFVMTRSSFAGTSKYAFKWLGDNGSQWRQLHWSIIGERLRILKEMGFQIGADICGFWAQAEYEMCLRWYQLGTFYPFARSHNIYKNDGVNFARDQDPTAWNSTFTDIVRHYIMIRYKFLPYMYTLFKEAHTEGKMVLRSLMFEFPEDKNTWSIDKQFMFGPALLISPALEAGQRSVNAYFPKGRWHDFYEGSEISSQSGKFVSLHTPLSFLPFHARGGSIIPVQNVANSTQFSRLNPMGLWCALDESNSANGTLYMDDGESLDSFSSGKYLELKFVLTRGERLDISVIHHGYTPPGNLSFTMIEFYGMISFPATLSINGETQEARHIRHKFNINFWFLDGQFKIKMSNQRSNSGRHTFFMCVLFLISAAAITMSAIAFNRMLKDDKTPSSTSSPKEAQQNQNFSTPAPSHGSTPEPDFRTQAVVDCDPPNSKNLVRADRNECQQKQCQWITHSHKRAPRCIFTAAVGYRMTGDIQLIGNSQTTAQIVRKGPLTVYSKPVHSQVDVIVDEYGDNALRIYFRPTNSNPYEIPDEALKIARPSPSTNKRYEVEFVKEPSFGIKITRKSTKTVIFDSSLPGMTISDQFLQISTRLPTDNLYGFGEHNHRRYRHDMNWMTWGIFTRDYAPNDEPWNLYSAHPVYMNLEKDGRANMVFLKNSNAMEVTLQPSPYPAVTYRTIGGVLDFYVFLGENPNHALQQYIQAIGKPPMPPYWSLGFHICRWGYGTLTEMEKVHQRNIDAEIPFDTQWGDIDYMYKKFDFTYDRSAFRGLPRFVNQVHDRKKRFVVIVDSGIGANQTLYNEAKVNSPGYRMYDDAVQSNILVKDGKDNILIGKVWPGQSVFPDFTNVNKTTQFWARWIDFFIKNESIDADGLWIDMDEPASFIPGSESGCEKNDWNSPPFIPKIKDGEKDGGNLYYKTLCMDAKQHWGRHYDVHSMYGHSESMVTHRALTQLRPNQRPFIVTRSSFVGTGHYASTWLGDNDSQWKHMHDSIVGMLEYQIFGFPMVGADICGFFGADTRDLCLRWYQLGTFYPFARSHNGIYSPTNKNFVEDQDPAAWDADFIGIVRHHLLLRYKFLPYMYTLFKEAHTEGRMVLRSLMFEFPDDPNTWSVDQQFMFGHAILVSPALENNKTTVDAYFPKGRWHTYTGDEEINSWNGQHRSLDAPLHLLNFHARGGSIIPLQDPSNSTYYSRLNPLSLWCALDNSYSATGTLFMDDGKSIDSITSGNYLELKFSLNKGTQLDITILHNGYTPPGNLEFTVIEISGLGGFPSFLYVDSARKGASHIRMKRNIVQIVDINLDVTRNHTLRWNTRVTTSQYAAHPLKSATMSTDGEKSGKRWKKVLAFVFVIVVLVVAIAAPIAISQSKPQYQYHKQDIIVPPQKKFYVQDDVIVDCTGREGTEAECKQTGCLWLTPRNTRAPRCIYPKQHTYALEGDMQTTDQTIKFTIRQNLNKTIFNTDIHKLINVTIDMYNPKALRIKFMPHVKPKPYEIPEEALPLDTTNQSGQRLYNVTIQHKPIFGIVVTRISTGAVVFNSSVPGLTFSEQFLQLTNRLPSENLYGFGEHNHQQFKHDMNWKTWPMFTRDTSPTDRWNLYGSHPVYMNLENDGNSNMVFLRNSNGMDIQVQPAPFPAVTYRVIGGILDFFVFLGPTPGEAVQQYVQTVGLPAMPPYWALGFHLCRWGYGNLTEMKKVRDRNVAAGIPMDTQWADIDYMYKEFDFTYDKVNFEGFPDFVNDLHNSGQRLVVIVDPGVEANQTIYKEAQNNSKGYNMYTDGHNKDIYVKMNGTELQGKVWPGLTVFPDFTNVNKTTEFWKTWINYFMKNESIPVDGLWIDMNEPANFVPGSIRGCQRNQWNNPPYVMPILEGEKDNGSLYYKTICMDATQHWGRHYDVHNLYGHSESMVTNKALQELIPTKRPFVLSRSTFSGTSKHAAKWLGDNRSQWVDMHWSIVGLLEFSIFGFPMIGADICGFGGQAQYEMCIRWHQLGAFYPFSRNHNAINKKSQDPAAWGGAFISNVRRHLRLRYKLLPYMYTLFKDAHTLGKTVVRPVMFEFPSDNRTWAIDRQFLLGSSILISPVLENNVRKVNAYFPKGRWFDYYKGTEIQGSGTGRNVTLEAPLSTLNLHLRGGIVIPVQDPGNTTKTSRLNPLGLLVDLKFETIDIYGQNRHPKTVKVDGSPVNANQGVTSHFSIIQLSNLGLNVNQTHTLELNMETK
ncbi:sucrase-isomaltase, intestinal-like [Saccostrea cucullata]|uniref:sucrase-isomaltase, intestinal-like n=1 Tax=Saccostrea cuccullata TaxID=36930 RepID=UPI002ED07625